MPKKREKKEKRNALVHIQLRLGNIYGTKQWI